MKPLHSDTHPEAEKVQLELIRRMPDWKKLGMVEDLNETVKVLAISGLRQRHPDATPEQIRRLLADLMLGTELARKVYDHAR
jgi:hypothetical protein